jgi:membrane dipeptidase
MHHRTDRRAFLAAAAAFSTAGLAPRIGQAAADPIGTLYRRAMVIDGNLVAPLDDQAPLPKADADAVRASGLTALKMTIGGSTGGFAATNEDIAAFDKAIAMSEGLYIKINSAADLTTAKRTGKVGVIFSFESAEMLEGKVDNIDHFAALGVKVMQLGYNLVSPFASGVMAAQPSPGLTPLGREAVARMNRLGVTLDLSHADARSTLQAVAASRRPVLITHAGCAAIHAHPRNKADEELRAVARSGGVVGIYELAYLDPGPAQQSLEVYLAHLLHALKVCGEDHVGIGSDAILTPFDTSPKSMEMWNKDIAARKAAGIAAPGEGRPPFVTGLNRSDRCEVIARALYRRGQPLRVIEKVLGSNFQRAFAETWRA